MSADERIMEALAGHMYLKWVCDDDGCDCLSSDCECGERCVGIDSVDDGHASHIAAILEPTIREREAAAWREGEKYGYAGAMNHAVPHLGNPYRIEAKR